MKTWLLLLFLLLQLHGSGQPIDSTQFRITAKSADGLNQFFTRNARWRGADGASAIDLKNGKLLWLFSDGFIGRDHSRSRTKSTIIRNSIALQEGYDPQHAKIKFYWHNTATGPGAFFPSPAPFWFWTGHGAMVKDRLVIFLIKEKVTPSGLGFEAIGWSIAIVANPTDDPAQWKIQYVEGPDTYGSMAGSAAVLTDEHYLYAFGSVEPDTHEAYLLRWTLDDIYTGNIAHPDWWINQQWAKRNQKFPLPEPLFIGATEYSVHYDSGLKKYLQIQTYGFGDARIGLRMADSLQGKWTDPLIFYAPPITGVSKPLIYAAKAHPELTGDGLYITYNINSLDFSELLNNPNIYFPKFVLLNISRRDKPYDPPHQKIH